MYGVILDAWPTAPVGSAYECKAHGMDPCPSCDGHNDDDDKRSE